MESCRRPAPEHRPPPRPRPYLASSYALDWSRIGARRSCRRRPPGPRNARFDRPGDSRETAARTDLPESVEESGSRQVGPDGRGGFASGPIPKNERADSSEPSASRPPSTAHARPRPLDTGVHAELILARGLPPRGHRPAHRRRSNHRPGPEAPVGLNEVVKEDDAVPGAAPGRDPHGTRPGALRETSSNVLEEVVRGKRQHAEQFRHVVRPSPRTLRPSPGTRRYGAVRGSGAVGRHLLEDPEKAPSSSANDSLFCTPAARREERFASRPSTRRVAQEGRGPARSGDASRAGRGAPSP